MSSHSTWYTVVCASWIRCTEEEVSVALVDAAPGDTILVHAKEAIAVVRA